MKKRIYILLFFSMILSCLTGCNKSVNQPSSEVINIDDIDIKNDTSSILNTTISLIDNINNVYKKDNIVISGLSVEFALAMLMNGTSEVATKQIEKFIDLEVDNANEYYNRLMKYYESQENNKVLVSNSFWINKENIYPIKNDYINLLTSNYQSKIEKIPMNDNGAKIINDWAKKVSKNLIKEVVNGEALQNMDTILMNAITFESKWKTPYTQDDTRERTFTEFDGTSYEIDMMCSNEYYYYENDNATAFRKDYKDGNYCFIGILPKKTGEFNLEDLDIDNLFATKKNVSELNAKLTVYLPKIDLADKYDLTEILGAMGIKEIFDVNKNNLSGVFDVNSNDFTSYVDKITQDVALIVDEEGTKASAITSIMTDGNSAPLGPENHLTIELNRPFVCIIMDIKNNIPLFVGKITSFEQ